VFFLSRPGLVGAEVFLRRAAPVRYNPIPCDTPRSSMSRTRKCLLLVAHGSRRETSNEEVRRLAAALRKRAGEEFHRVDCAFLELAKPSIPAGIEACIRAGAEEVIVVPYFLSAGRHVAEDIPAEVAKKQQEYPAVPIRIVAYLGAAEAVPDLLLDAARQPSGAL
jgi:sirohydrochlorin ferrochelatase